MIKQFAATSMAVLTVLFTVSCSAFESHLKMRMHREVIASAFTKNFDILLRKIEKVQERDAVLDDIKATMTDLYIVINPVNQAKWDTIQNFETIFDDNQIILESHELEFTGKGKIIDSSTGAEEQIVFHAPMSTCQIVLSLGEEYASWGSLYPRFNVDQVLFQIDNSLITVSAYGDLPLYQSHQFEKSVKNWFSSQITKRQQEFKTGLQLVEKNIWKSVPFS